MADTQEQAIISEIRDSQQAVRVKLTTAAQALQTRIITE
jgi:hypothetical protein